MTEGSSQCQASGRHGGPSGLAMAPGSDHRTSLRLVGCCVERVEDTALFTGHGRFADDVGARPGTAHAAVLRSPRSSGEIVGIDAPAALSMPDVVAVLTGEDIAA